MWKLFIGLALVTPAAAQTVIDGSDGGLAPHIIKEVITGASRGLRDPLAAQFRDLKLSPVRSEIVCGAINGKNGYGAYVGFRRFYYDLNTREVNIYEPKPPSDILYELSRMPHVSLGCGQPD